MLHHKWAVTSSSARVATSRAGHKVRGRRVVTSNSVRKVTSQSRKVISRVVIDHNSSALKVAASSKDHNKVASSNARSRVTSQSQTSSSVRSSKATSPNPRLRVDSSVLARTGQIVTALTDPGKKSLKKTATPKS